MCGIVGQFSIHFQSEDTKPVISKLMSLMRRRGPDDEGFWSDGQHCAFGFRRLSILDLSPAGHQPMLTQDGRYALVMNGEVYNFLELRRQLEQVGVRFRSTGDAEVVLYALAHWGVQALDRFNGMFALAFYDIREKCLLLARDHAGIKPLYYLLSDRGLVFGSQYDQIMAHPWAHDLGVRPDALWLYLSMSYIPAPYALLDRTHALEAGCWIELDAQGNQRQGSYFTFPKNPQPDLNGEEAFEAVDAAVTNAVRRQLVSDVPVGTFLSGGIDSPLVTAKACSITQSPIKAFTMASEDERFDESRDAIKYAQELGVDHIVETATSSQAYDMLDDVISACTEPVGDYSIIPTMMISRLARQQVTVMLSGDGGDELFWGYAARFGPVVQKSDNFRLSRFVRTVRWGVEKIFKLGQGNYYPYLFNNIGEWYRAKHTRISDQNIAQAFPTLSGFPESFDLFSFNGFESKMTANWMRWNEYVGHLSMVLQKVDRASMYNSLEIRVPLLDREVIDTALRVDWLTCLDATRLLGKIPLRKSLARHVKYQTLTKRGFSIPMDAWLRGPLREMFEEIVLRRKEILGFPFDSQPVRIMYEGHQNGDANYSFGLWSLLSLILWEDSHVRNLRILPYGNPWN